jgi:cysteinyl-tRNA synthetase
VEFDDERLGQAAADVRRIREAGRRLLPGPSPAWSAPLRERFFDALANDFNTPSARAGVFDWVAEANRSREPVGGEDLREMLGVLGLDNLLEQVEAEIPAEVVELSEAREQARATRDYGEADRLREQIRARGWEVRDGPDGPELLPAA